ncbi:MAG: hypothetical protein NZ534_09640, partial [Bacteroidia bacterium]|nr:hypothetical protein [Bacteroidia bacterium]
MRKLFWLGLLTTTNVWGQDALTLPGPKNASLHAAKTAEQTPVVSIPRVALPFFDSFLQAENYPDSTRWTARQPTLICRRCANRPPDYGTALFDGLDAQRTVYSVNNEHGAADSL